MKPRMNVSRRIVQRHVWMVYMLASLTGDESNRLNRIRREGDALQLFAIVDIGKALLKQGGAITALVPDSATDDEAEAILMDFIDKLPEPQS